MPFFLSFFLMIWTLTSVAAVLPLRLKINSFRDSKILTALGSMNSVEIGQNLGVRGQGHIGLIGFVRIVGLEKVSLPNGPGQSATTQNLVVVELIRGSQYNMIRIGDELVSFDLSSATEDYMGSTELIVREEAANTSARFKPLFTQGILIGETAQTLANNEFMFTWYGLVHFGLASWMSIGTLVPADVTNSPNVTAKFRFFESARNTVATGVTLRRIPEGDRYTVNWNLMWDAYSNEKTVSHTFATLAIYSIEKAQDTTAIKSGGTSTFQTGYEYITDNWGRILYGPNYNFETKAIGAYLAYAKIWDHFNLQATLYSTNVQNVRWNVQDGYIVYMDAYWRF